MRRVDKNMKERVKCLQKDGERKIAKQQKDEECRSKETE